MEAFFECVVILFKNCGYPLAEKVTSKKQSLPVPCRHLRSKFMDSPYLWAIPRSTYADLKQQHLFHCIDLPSTPYFIPPPSK